MKNLATSSALACEHDFEAELLERHDDYIKMLVRKKVQYTPALRSDLETDELTQRVRIKLWQRLQKSTISNPRAYIRCVVDTVAMDMIRHFKVHFSLVIDEEGEPGQSNLLITSGRGMRDPLDELVQIEGEAEVLKKIIVAIISLPLCQRRAFICAMKDNVDDIHMLVSAFNDFGIDIEPIQSPTVGEDIRRHRASLSISRKKLRPLLMTSSLEDAS